MPGRGGDEAYGDNLIAFVSPSVTAKWAKGSGGPSGDEMKNLIAYSLNARDASGPLPDRSMGNVVTRDTGVRRITPIECERLMGWPDDHTRYADSGKEIADSHRYKMCGNGVAAPVAKYIATCVSRILS